MWLYIPIKPLPDATPKQLYAWQRSRERWERRARKTGLNTAIVSGQIGRIEGVNIIIS